MNKSISVIIPTYNRAGVIKRAIKSGLSQMYLVSEIIVSDDGSTDNTEEIVRAFNDPRIIWLSATSNNSGRPAIPRDDALDVVNLLVLSMKEDLQKCPRRLFSDFLSIDL